MRRAWAALAALTVLATACAPAGGSQPARRPAVPTPTAPTTAEPEQPSATPVTDPAKPRRHRHHRLAASGGPAMPTAIAVGRKEHRILSAPVDPIEASVGTGIDPPVWGRAVFWTGSHEPASPSQGTTAVYAHACTHHVCPFTDLHLAQVGQRVVLGSARGRFVYRIVRIVSLPKVDLAAFSFAGYDLALITCELPGEGSELDNRMVLGVLTGFRPARS